MNISTWQREEEANSPEGDTLRLRLRLSTLRNLLGSSLVDASSASSSSFCRSLMVSCGPRLEKTLVRFLRIGTMVSSSTPSLADGLYCLLNIDFFLSNPPPRELTELDLVTLAPTTPSAASRACSFKKALNSAGAISGWRRAGTQKRCEGSSATSPPPDSLLSSCEELLESSVADGVQ